MFYRVHLGQVSLGFAAFLPKPYARCRPEQTFLESIRLNVLPHTFQSGAVTLPLSSGNEGPRKSSTCYCGVFAAVSERGAVTLAIHRQVERGSRLASKGTAATSRASSAICTLGLTGARKFHRFYAHAGAATMQLGRFGQFNGSGGGAHTSPSTLCAEGPTSVQAISWVIDNSKHKGNTFVVLLMIANHAKSDGSGAWPSVHTIAKESRLSDRTVQRCIKRLSLYWKKIWPAELLVRTGKGPYGSNLYDIPGVKLSPPGVKTGKEGVSDTVTTPVSELCHPNRPLTVHKDKNGMWYRITPERTREYLRAEECPSD